MKREKLSKVLRYCLGLNVRDVDADTLVQMSLADWDELVVQSLRHSVTPLLYERFRDTATTLPVPSAVVAQVRKISFLTATTNLRFYDELSRVTSLLQGVGVPSIALKGAHLAASVYDNVALRPMCDIDLLIHKSDLARVDRLLREKGYIPSDENARWLEDYRHLGYRSRSGGVSLQFHWIVDIRGSRYRVDYDGLFERACFENLRGVRTLTLSPVDLILHLCIHGAYLHLYEFGLRTLFDVSEALRHYEPLDWRELEGRSRIWRCTRCVFLTLRVAKDLVGAPVPSDVLDALEPKEFDRRFADWAQEEVLCGAEVGQRSLSMSPDVARMLIRRGISSKVGYLLRRAWPSRESIEQRYGTAGDSKRFYWYYLVNLKDFVTECGAMAGRLLRRGAEVRVDARRATLKDWLAASDPE